MKQTLKYTALLLFTLGCTKKSITDTDWPVVTNETKPWTRWWWLGSDVDTANLAYNLEALSDAGIGGVEVTPIYGVKGRQEHYIGHLSPRWMEMWAFTRTKASQLQMAADMNAGTGWPFGGPEITIQDAATKAIFQTYELKGGESLSRRIEVSDKKQADFAYLDKLIAYTPDGQATDLTDKVSSGRLEWTAPAGTDYRLVALFIGKTLQKVKRAAPGGAGYVLNHFDKDAVSRYLSKFDKAFAESKAPFPHSFFNDSYEVYGADWTPDLLIQFERRRGYKLQDHFPELLADGATDTSARVISDYRETVGEILKENFTQVWTDWAHAHGVTTRNQAHGSPANLIDQYAVVDIPECESFGITDFDIPFLRKDSIRKQNDSDPTILKYASSAAHITGKKFTSSETFTWLTEHFRTSLSQCKPEIDQMFASGVNRVFFHGTTYSPQDAPWPGWKFYASVDMSPTNSIWKDAPAFFNYINRVQSFLQDGRPDNDFLLYLPMYDIWEEQRGGFFTTFAIHGMRERLPKFCEGVDKIMQCGHDLDYISDHFIQSTTVTADGLLKTTGGTTYKALIVPGARLIPLETISKLRDLALKGATIIFSDRYPDDVPGLSGLNERRRTFDAVMKQFPPVNSFRKVSVNRLGKGTIITGSDYSEILSGYEAVKESFITDYQGQLVRRSHADGHIYFFTMLQNNPVDAWVPLGVSAKSALFFDPLTGKKGLAALRQKNGKTEAYMQLEPGQSIILKTFSTPRKGVDKWAYYRPSGELTRLGNGWELAFTESEPVIRQTFKLPSAGSWTALDGEDLKRNMGTGRYTIRFDFRKNPGSAYTLDLKDVRESARVSVNGKDAGIVFAVPFKINIGPLLRTGENTLEIDVTNLPANRISDYDRRGVEWRIFEEINFVSITYKDTRFDQWAPVPSGLLGPVTIEELRPLDPVQATIR